MAVWQLGLAVKQAR